MICLHETTIGWIGSSFFLGWALSAPFITPLSDKLGRKWLVVAAGAAGAVFYSLMLFGRSVWVVIAMQFLNGVLTSARTGVGFIYMCEFVPPEWIGLVTTIFNVVDGSSTIVITLYFEFISKHWFWIASVGLVYNIVSITAIAIFVPESPLYLLKTKQFSRAQTILKQVLKPSNPETLALIDNLD